MKRWWLPTQKGTQLWPRTTVQPPKLVIHGVRTGTPLYRAVAAHFSGRLSQFHGKAQQGYALSSTDTMKIRQAWPDARATYSNIYGQEILSLEVDHGLLKELHEERQKFYRDMVLISFEYADAWGVRPVHSAYLHHPVVAELPTGGTLVPVRGVAHELPSSITDDGSEQPILSFPPFLAGKARYEAPFVNIAADGNHRSTVLLDTRPITGLPMYVFDVYCQMNVGTNVDSTCIVSHYTSSTDGGTVLIDEEIEMEYVVSTGICTSPAEIAGMTIAEAGEFYETQYGIDNLAHDVYDGPAGQITEDYQGNVTWGTRGEINDFGLGTFFINWAVTVWTWTPIYQRLPAGGVERDALVRGTFVYPSDNLGISYTSGIMSYDDGSPCGAYNVEQQFYGWELEDLYPERPVHIDLGMITASSTAAGGPATIANHLAKQFVCRIIYDREHDALSMSTTPPV